MNTALTFGAAFLLGLAASGHCIVMCGGISGALGLATARDANGRMRPALLIGYQVGRVVSYSIAGLLFAGALGGVIAMLDIEIVRQALRAISAAALLFAALAAFGVFRTPDFVIGSRLWPKVSHLGRRLLPVARFPNAFAFGMLWGWMPCGFVFTVLLIATLQADALHGALTMAAFGLGTMPALLVASFGAQRLRKFAALPAYRHTAGSVLVLCAALTLTGPWLAHAMPALHGWIPFDCAT